MTPVMTTLVIISLIALLAISVQRFIRYRNLVSFLLQLAALSILALIFFNFFYSTDIIAKGDEASLAFVILLYSFMILGMLANFGYEWFSRPRHIRLKKKFDFGLFIAPVFLSPIIFFPLYEAFRDAQADPMQMTSAKVTMFLVAFENGFFWKAYFDNKRKEIERGQNAKIS